MINNILLAYIISYTHASVTLCSVFRVRVCVCVYDGREMENIRIIRTCI